MADIIEDVNDCEVPPLEDMGDMLKQINRIHKKKDNIPKTQQPVHTVVHNSEQRNSKQETKRVEKKKQNTETNRKDSSSFGGFKKGFLFGGSKETKVSSKEDDGIPFIKAKSSSEKRSDHVFDEVQNAMKSATDAFTKNKDWITEDLLQKIQKNPTLAKRLADPSFMQAITEFQTNPQGAMAKYGGNPEMQSFLKEFCGLMGDHLSQMPQSSANESHESQSEIKNRTADAMDMKIVSSTDPKQATQADDDKIQELLSDPETREALMDPTIQRLIQMLKEDPHQAQRLLKSADQSLYPKIQRLVNVGLLQFQR